MKTSPPAEACPLEKPGKLDKRGFALIRCTRLGQKRHGLHQKGFSLIVTLMMMILLTVIVVGLLTLSSVSLRASTNGKDQAQARANAKLALMMALGDLQKYAGPDQRVTASAGVGRNTEDPPKPFTNNIHWTGVWSTTALGDPTKPMVGANTDLAAPAIGAIPTVKALTDRRNIDPALINNQWNNKLRLAWLVSGNTPNPVAAAAINKVKLVGEGTLGSSPAAADEITVPMVSISASGTSTATGGYAYWVGDESQKARIDQKATDKQPSLGTPTDGGMARLAGAEGPNFRFVKSGTTPGAAAIQDLTAEKRSKLVTPGTAVVALNNPDAIKKNYHDLTSYSRSVLADAREGGLQKDMTAYINSTSSAGIPAIANIPESGLTHVTSPYSTDLAISGKPMFPGSIYETYGPNFLQLRNWYDLRKKVTGGLSSKAIDPVFLPDRPSSYTFYGPMPDIKAHAQAVQPYMTDCKIAYDFSVDMGRPVGTGHAVRLHVYPRVTLWNPYNVKLAAQTYLVGFLKDINDQKNVNGTIICRGLKTTATPIPPTTGAAVAVVARPDNADFYGNGVTGSMVYFALNAPIMNPGECLVFSPDTGGAESVKYDVNDVTLNALSPNKPSNGLSNFYFDSNRALTPPAGYTVLGSRYDTKTGENRQFVLKKAGTSSGISHVAAQNSSSHPVIQRISMGSCGESVRIWSDPAHGYQQIGEASKLLKESAAHDGNVPSRSFYVEGRLQWMDENRSEKHGLGDFPTRKSIIANYNIRPNIVHRSNFCKAHEQWYWQFGPYLESRVEQRTLDDVAFGSPPGGKSYGSPFGYPADYSTVKSYVMFDVPAQETPVFSLACFQHVQLGYQGWQPTYAIGNSMCEPRCGSGPAGYNSQPKVPYLYRDLPVHEAYADLRAASNGWGTGAATYKNAWNTALEINRDDNLGRWHDLVQNSAPNTAMTELLFYDTSYMVNHALWDRFFLSSIPCNSSGTPIWTDDTKVLPNTRMVLNSDCPNAASERTAKITGTNTFDYSSYFLMNEGAFNINSISVEAWRAFFSSMNDVSRPTNDGKVVVGAFSRLLTPNTDDSNGNHLTAGPWNSARKLSEPEIDALAIAMVEAVKHRGPFLGLADFVNRRLLPHKGSTIGDGTTPGVFNETNENLSPAPDPSLCGPLQAAIEKAQINSTLQTTGIYSPTLTQLVSVPGGDAISRNADCTGWGIDNRTLNPDYWAFAPWKTFGAPGYVTQADILQTIGSSIIARGDTFVIRGYGEARDKNGNVTAKAWCEAVVQRTPDYVAANSISTPSDANGNNPLEPIVIRDAADYTLDPNPKLLPINKTFGRKFVINQLRWLSPSEI